MATTISERAKADEARALSSLEAALNRLEDTLTEENANLEANTAHDHAGSIVRKNQILRDLMLLQRMEGNASAVAALKPRLRDIRSLVDRNHQLLKSQVDAMTGITMLLTNAAMMESADGTYSRHARTP